MKRLGKIEHVDRTKAEYDVFDGRYVVVLPLGNGRTIEIDVTESVMSIHDVERRLRDEAVEDAVAALTKRNQESLERYGAILSIVRVEFPQFFPPTA